MDPFAPMVKALHQAQVRYLVVGVGGANYYAWSGGTVFTTDDRDVFLPADPANMLRAWEASTAAGFALWVGNDSRLSWPDSDLKTPGAGGESFRLREAL